MIEKRGYSGTLKAEYLPARDEWRILEPFTYFDGENKHEIPAGWDSDLSSTKCLPPVLAKLFPPSGPWNQAAVLHDYLYGAELYNRAYADRVFKKALEDIPAVPRWKIPFMYSSVRMFGGVTYKTHTLRTVQALRKLLGIYGVARPLYW